MFLWIVNLTLNSYARILSSKIIVQSFLMVFFPSSRSPSSLQQISVDAVVLLIDSVSLFELWGDEYFRFVVIIEQRRWL